MKQLSLKGWNPPNTLIQWRLCGWWTSIGPRCELPIHWDRHVFRRRLTGATWSNNPVRQGASTPCNRPFQLPHKKTAGDARAMTVNPANEHVGKGKINYLCRRRHKEEVKQMGTFRRAACVMNENSKIEAGQKGIKSNFVCQPVPQSDWGALKVKLSPSWSDRIPVKSVLHWYLEVS